MRDRRWATGQDGRGGRLFEFVLVTIASVGLTVLVVELVAGMVAPPMAAAAAVLQRAAGAG